MTLLSVEALVREYRLPRRSAPRPRVPLRVLHGIDLALDAGGSLGIVGESGSGKSTLARTVMALEAPQAGRVRFAGESLFELSRPALRRARQGFQAIFQDPYGSLDPRHTARRIVAEPIAALDRATPAADRRRRVEEALADVGLPGAGDRYPHEFSGGQRQRIAIARALVTRPRLIVADEPVSALDVSVQAQVLNLMLDLQASRGLAYLFISHDLSVVRLICDTVAVLYLGRIVEHGPTATVLATPRHPYTEALLDAAPHPGRGRRRRQARQETLQPPPHTGCPYAPRCPRAAPRCTAEAPILRPLTPTHRAACHFA